MIDLLANVTLPFGLRTVDGSQNNLVPSQSEFGAADNHLPAAGAIPSFQTADPVAFPVPGPQAVGDPTSYTQNQRLPCSMPDPRTITPT